MTRRIPTEAQIIDALHDAGNEPVEECIAQAIRSLTPAGASDEAREAISADVRKVWLDRFHIWGAA